MTPWRASATRVRGRTYVGILLRTNDRRQTESSRCPHLHRSQGAALECANKALRRVQANGGELL